MENGRFSLPKLGQLPIDTIHGIGPQFAENLRGKEIQSIEDLLYVLPKAYVDRSIIHSIKDLLLGQKAHIFGIIKEAYIAYFKNTKKSLFEITIDDGTGKLKAVWFNFNRRYVKNVFKKGDSIFLSGEISQSSKGELECIHPEVEFVKASDIKKREKILPKYRDLAIFPKVHRKALFHIIDKYLDPHTDDHIPRSLLPESLQMNIYDTFKRIHFPDEYNDKVFENERLKYSEIFYYLLGLKQKRITNLNEPSYPVSINYEIFENVIKNLSFQLTKDQQHVLTEIMADIQKSYPMSRMLIGDVGSGKTIIAMLIAFAVISAGYQVALLAPTQLLAHQHRKYVHEYFANIEDLTTLLVGISKDKKEILENIEKSEKKLIIGTHALLSETIQFQNLGLVIIDEEHKFGVIQKALLLQKKPLTPHMLSMSATPIPRSLGEIIYADKDISLINKRPIEPRIQTMLFHDSEDTLYRMIQEQISLGTQAYIVLPRIKSHEKMKNKSIHEYTTYLIENYFTDFKIGLLHGEQKEEENIKTLEAFQKQKIDIIVATSIIEVGIHNENANILVVIDPEYFGLIQLHQLRGRIGRGKNRGVCYLVIKETISPLSLERLKLLESVNDGFMLSQEDYKLRGMGELEGYKQSGFPDFRFIDLKNDMALITLANTHVTKILATDPHLEKEEHRGIVKVLRERWC